jgi:hypothetical protein
LSKLMSKIPTMPFSSRSMPLSSLRMMLVFYYDCARPILVTLKRILFTESDLHRDPDRQEFPDCFRRRICKSFLILTY